MGRPTVSVIIPAYNAAQTIGRALDSLLTQTWLPDEILVVDDGSSDDLESVLLSYGHSVKVVRKKNGGAAAARNLGIEYCQGDLISFLDADDYWEPTKLQRQLDILQRYSQVGMVTCRCYLDSGDRPRFAAAVKLCPPMDRVLELSGPAAFDFATRTVTPTVILRRQVLGAQRFDPMLKTAEDRDLWVRLAVSCPVYSISQPLVTIVLEPRSLSRSDLDLDCRNMLRVIHRYHQLLGRTHLRRWEARIFRRWASGCLSQGRPADALAFAWRRLWRQPLSPEGWWIVLKSMAWRLRSRKYPIAPEVAPAVKVEART